VPPYIELNDRSLVVQIGVSNKELELELTVATIKPVTFKSNVNYYRLVFPIKYISNHWLLVLRNDYFSLV